MAASAPCVYRTNGAPRPFYKFIQTLIAVLIITRLPAGRCLPLLSTISNSFLFPFPLPVPCSAYTDIHSLPRIERVHKIVHRVNMWRWLWFVKKNQDRFSDPFIRRVHGFFFLRPPFLPWTNHHHHHLYTGGNNGAAAAEEDD